jgi:hypothetical protein
MTHLHIDSFFDLDRVGANIAVDQCSGSQDKISRKLASWTSYLAQSFGCSNGLTRTHIRTASADTRLESGG